MRVALIFLAFVLSLFYLTIYSTSSAALTEQSNCWPGIEILSPVVDGPMVTINGAVGGCPNSLVSWNWGDGQVSVSEFPAVHTYCSSGLYNITATATTPKGENVSVPTFSVRVTGEPCPPALFLYTPVVMGNSVIVNGTALGLTRG